MKRKEHTKRALAVSALSVLLSAALLLGTTLAWFTDSVTNTGNSIQAGTLGITATVADYKEGGSPEISVPAGIIDGDKLAFNTAKDLETAGAIISETNWEPGQSNAKLLEVKNNGSLAAKIKLNFAATDGGLMNALWFDFIQVDADNQVTGQFTEREMSTLAVFAQNLELSLAPKGETGDTVRFLLVYGMKEEAGNEYQGTAFSANVTILATQDTYEKDGFGSDQYDKDAGYPVMSTVGAGDNDALLNAVGQTGVPVEIDLTSSLTNVKNFAAKGDVTLNMGKNMLSSGSSSISGATLKVEDGGSLTLNAEANDSGFDYTAGGLMADGEGTELTVNGGRYGVSGANGAEVKADNGSTATINDGIFSSSGAWGHAVMAANDATVYVKGGRFSCSGYQSTLFYADGGTIVIDACEIGPVNGKRYAAANGGKILLSKTVSSSQPTSVADGCTVTDNGDGYWLITGA